MLTWNTSFSPRSSLLLSSSTLAALCSTYIYSAAFCPGIWQPVVPFVTLTGHIYWFLPFPAPFVIRTSCVQHTDLSWHRKQTLRQLTDSVEKIAYNLGYIAVSQFTRTHFELNDQFSKTITRYTKSSWDKTKQKLHAIPSFFSVWVFGLCWSLTSIPPRMVFLLISSFSCNISLGGAMNCSFSTLTSGAAVMFKVRTEETRKQWVWPARVIGWEWGIRTTGWQTPGAENCRP